MKLVAAAVILASALGACVGGELVTGDRRNVGVVSVVFSARPSQARVGQAVRLSLRLVNNSGRGRDVVFAHEQTHDFWATRGEREVWRWSEDQVFEQTPFTLRLGPQEPETYNVTWTPDTAGTYRIFGAVVAPGYDKPLSGRVTVE